MNMISLHALEALRVLENGLPGGAICTMNDGWVVGSGSYGSHFDLNGLNAVALVCSDEVFGAFGRFKGCYGESLFVVCVDDFFYLRQSILAKLGV